jgi:hypothetical protein
MLTSQIEVFPSISTYNLPRFGDGGFFMCNDAALDSISFDNLEGGEGEVSTLPSALA